MSQFIKVGGGNGCADGDTCPSAVHTGSERQTFLVVGTRVTNPADLQQLNIGAGEVANEIPDSLFPEARPLVTAPAALGAFIDRQGPGELVRVETLLRYDVESDGGDFRRYRDGLPGPDPARKAARHRVLKARRDRGLVMRRVHIVRRHHGLRRRGPLPRVPGGDGGHTAPLCCGCLRCLGCRRAVRGMVGRSP